MEPSIAVTNLFSGNNGNNLSRNGGEATLLDLHNAGNFGIGLSIELFEMLLFSNG